MLGPIVFGNLIDGFCIQWESSEDSCTGRGACRLYDNDIFRWKLIGYQTLCRLLGLVLIASALVIAIVTKKFDTADVDTKGIENFEMAENRQSRLRENTWP
nr:hypothetical protein BaRGS_003727 [Batillaria attramentaria]